MPAISPAARPPPDLNCVDCVVSLLADRPLGGPPAEGVHYGLMKVEWSYGPRPQGLGGRRHPTRRRPHVLLVDDEARRLHADVHQAGCWCDGLDGDKFLLDLFQRVLNPRGFRIDCFHTGPGLKVTDGPGLREGSVDELERAIRERS